ncbi:DUF4450 domain-containing protein [Lewinella sp. IMCC34191]|uniref:DUF4450 domain-containing protein n=1 Tax=Lewinella sp. IMCC34191 TaxID=2259172 RepID=UPI0013007C1E|nr:DUF4450 domain-containing protein [Lewinella sp. IMCC34191]
MLLTLGCFTALPAQVDSSAYWHGIPRSVRYAPEGGTFVIENGERRFNRALYGGPSGFRVEAGDLPEFALYRPRLAGTLRFGLVKRDDSRWLIEAQSIRAVYDPGKMRYTITDPLLGADTLELEVLALRDTDGMVYRFRASAGSRDADLLLAFGGASDERFSREGDIGADPESVFYLTPEHATGNKFTIDGSAFTLTYGQKGDGAQVEGKQLRGNFPKRSALHLADASHQESPRKLQNATPGDHPVLTAKTALATDWQYGVVVMGATGGTIDQARLPSLFARADKQRLELVNRVRVTTPDPYINTLGGALAVAADGIWEDPAYHHGAIAWRQQLVGWRGAYVADPLGWHDRGRTHFSAYAKSQLTEPATGPVVPDTSRNFARQVEEIGTAVFTEGYISRYPGGERLRAHHYDMNQVYIDALLRHLDWTGDLEMARRMWPVIERHLAWEKRNFDADGDHLYDAYCSIWASDAVQYSGGGVTHASSYHYYANTRAAELAERLGKDPEPYRREARRILAALNKQLWLPERGTFAEYQDLLGLQLRHTSPAVWTVYHALDSEVPDPFQAYQLTDYVGREIPRIPIRAEGLADTSLYTISTTNWLPYTWSVNNVALAEVMHTSLAYWQANRPDDAYRLWKSALMESMYLGASPGSIQQLSFYDAIRGELYRDFADPIAMVARTLVEGLFGIRPDMLNGKMIVEPGFPAEWDRASISLPDIDLAFTEDGAEASYVLTSRLSGLKEWDLRIAPRKAIKAVRLNGEPVSWSFLEEAIGQPKIRITAPAGGADTLQIQYGEKEWQTLNYPGELVSGENYEWAQSDLSLLDIHDPQGVWDTVRLTGNGLRGTASDNTGAHTFFVRLRQGKGTWWSAVSVSVVPAFYLRFDAKENTWRVRNNTGQPQAVDVYAGGGQSEILASRELAAGEESQIRIPDQQAVGYGTSRLSLTSREGTTVAAQHTDWSGQIAEGQQTDFIDLQTYLNAPLGKIFEAQYYTPRPSSPTVQLPVTGIGNWCYPNVEMNIDPSGLWAAAGSDRVYEMPSGLGFQLAGEPGVNNIAFTSRWDRFPDTLAVPLAGKAEHLYLLMAGSTNPMQSRLDNGVVEVRYTDGTNSQLTLRNPDNWVPIEQDYYLDGYAFYADGARPPRVHLKDGSVPEHPAYIDIKGFSTTGIDGGAATVLDLPLDPGKELQSLTLRTLANDVVIGLLAATLVRP